jgi:hypothetical protein
MSSTSVNILDESSVKSTIISVSNTLEIPLMEGNSKSCEIIIPERNDVLNKSILDDAMCTNRRIAIRPTRLKLLLDMETKLRNIEEKRKETLRALHAKEKENIDSVKERVKRYVDTHRDEINTRRREKRKLASEKPTSNIIIIKRTILPQIQEKTL